MRMKTVKVLGTVALWVERILEVHLPMNLVYGLRTAAAAQKSHHV